ncbi:hypothetical protein ABIB82_007874 [Bradyrhizobium sp. i1.8.4]|uniref:hypothetical protein n=1 Tax=unclassified Bradyrhizobium TaxID=2631580 RepID=UPI003D1F746B
MIIQMIQHSPKLLRSNLLWIERDVLLDETRPGGLIIPPSLKLLSSSVSFLQHAVLRSGGADAPRPAQRLIDNFERNQREDRDEIRGLQKRIEGLVGEIGALKGKASGGEQKVRARSARSSGSRPR